MTQELTTQRAEDASHKYPLTRAMKEDARLRGVPLFLQTQNRVPLTSAQQVRWDEKARAAAGGAPDRSDFRKPKGMAWEEWDALEAAAQAIKRAASHERSNELRERKGVVVGAAGAPKAPRVKKPALTGYIVVSARICPYRAGSAGAIVFALYADGMTVDEFMKKAAGHTGKRRPADMLGYDVHKGYVAIKETKS